MPIDNQNQNNDQLARPRAAYNRLLTEIDAVADEELVTINIDVPTAVTTALGVVPELAPFVEPAKKLPDFDAACFTKLEDYALALSHAHTLYSIASAPPDAIAELASQATDARELLLSDVRALAKHGLIEPSRVAEMERGLGHKGVAYDIAKLVEILRERWDAVSGKTAITGAKLTELEMLSDKLLSGVGLREQAPATKGAAAERRQKAFTLFMRAYQEVRSAVAYLRRKRGDVDQIVPSLYSGRTSPRRKDVQPVAPQEPLQPQQATTTNGNGGGAPVAPGLPGSSPFQS